MKLIGIGLPRTGTLSQKTALEILGFGPCYHMDTVIGDLDRVAQWRRALDGNPDWDEIFDGFEATVDQPGAYFHKELIEAYPDAKVLLSVRDSKAWAKSIRGTIWSQFYGDTLVRHLSDARCFVDPQWRAFIELTKEMWYRRGVLTGPETTDEWISNAMERFHVEMLETVPADRLLVWSVSDGWQPLCDFLGVPVPDAPFPRVNDTATFGDRIIDGALSTLQRWRTTST